MGGIQSGRDALDFVRRRSDRCVAVGTENFRDPAAAERVRDELARLLANAGAAHVRTLSVLRRAVVGRQKKH